MNIYQRMNAVAEEISRIPKNLTVGFGRNQYRAVAEADVLQAVKKAEKKHGIASYPASRRIVESRTIHKITRDKDGNEETKESQFIRAEVIYRFVNIDDPAESVEVTSYGDGIDSQDKSPGKAMTYADKYALMKAYKIETGDEERDAVAGDPDGHNIFMVKQRIEEKLTKLQLKKIAVDDVLPHVGASGVSKKQLDLAMRSVNMLNALEQELDKRL